MLRNTVAIAALAVGLAGFQAAAYAEDKNVARIGDPEFATDLPAAADDELTTASVGSENPYDARGVVVPNAEVTLGAGVTAPITKMPYKPGTAFNKGDTLIGFDCGRQRADLRAAKASLSKASMFLSGKRRLLKRGAAGRQEVREAGTDVTAAKAQVDGLATVVSLCTVKAPFAGRVLEKHADEYEIPAANAPVLTVVDDSQLELDLIVPSKWLRWVKPGTSFQFEVDEVGRSFEAKVARVGAKVDAVSQTVKLTGMFRLRPANVLAGMSGTAKFAPELR